MNGNPVRIRYGRCQRYSHLPPSVFPGRWYCCRNWFENSDIYPIPLAFWVCGRGYYLFSFLDSLSSTASSPFHRVLLPPWLKNPFTISLSRSFSSLQSLHWNFICVRRFFKFHHSATWIRFPVFLLMLGSIDMIWMSISIDRASLNQITKGTVWWKPTSYVHAIKQISRDVCELYPRVPILFNQSCV